MNDEFVTKQDLVLVWLMVFTCVIVNARDALREDGAGAMFHTVVAVAWVALALGLSRRICRTVEELRRRR